MANDFAILFGADGFCGIAGEWWDGQHRVMKLRGKDGACLHGQMDSAGGLELEITGSNEGRLVKGVRYCWPSDQGRPKSGGVEEDSRAFEVAACSIAELPPDEAFGLPDLDPVFGFFIQLIGGLNIERFVERIEIRYGAISAVGRRRVGIDEQPSSHLVIAVLPAPDL